MGMSRGRSRGRRGAEWSPGRWDCGAGAPRGDRGRGLGGPRCRRRPCARVAGRAGTADRRARGWNAESGQEAGPRVSARGQRCPRPPGSEAGRTNAGSSRPPVGWLVCPQRPGWRRAGRVRVSAGPQKLRVSGGRSEAAFACPSPLAGRVAPDLQWGLETALGGPNRPPLTAPRILHQEIKLLGLRRPLPSGVSVPPGGGAGSC